MSSSPVIKCDICGYEFKTYKVMETHYEDYEPCEEPRYYPLESENAHLIRNYICDKCYKNFSNIIKQQLINSCKEHLDGIEDDFAKAEQNYLKEVLKIKEKKQQLEEAVKVLENTEVLLKLPQEVRDFIERSSYYFKGQYYFQNALNWEKEQYLKQKPLRYWEKQFNVDILSYPEGVNWGDWVTEEGVNWGDWVTEEEYLNMLLDCKVKDMTSRDILNIIEKYKSK